jgi:hypothetical protein
MNRRDLLAQMSLLAADSLFGRLAQASAAGAALHSPPAKSVLDESQRTMVAQLAELIIPATDTPGAGAAGVPAFIDRIVSEWYTATERGIFIEGLASLDAFCTARHGKRFGACSKQQQTLALEDADERTRAYQSKQGRIFDAPDEHSPFFFKLKQLTVLGYYTSETGATTELAYNPVPGRYDGDVDFATVGRQWSF